MKAYLFPTNLTITAQLVSLQEVLILLSLTPLAALICLELMNFVHLLNYSESSNFYQVFGAIVHAHFHIV